MTPPRSRGVRRLGILGLYVALVLLHHALRPSERHAGGEWAVVGGEAGEALVVLGDAPGSDRALDIQLQHLVETGTARVVRVDVLTLARETGATSYRRLAEIVDGRLARDEFLGPAGRYSLIATGDGACVGLRLAQLDSSRLRSLVLWQASGVQEFDLLGTHELNRLLYSLQWAALAATDVFVPHFGWFDGSVGVAELRARIRKNSDRRPLRAVLERVEAPVLVVHRDLESPIPIAVAREHARIVPQSELTILSADGGADGLLERWLARIAQGSVPDRSAASPARVAQAELGLSRQDWVRAHGQTLRLLLFLLVVGTFITEDLTSIAAGLLIAEGRLSWAQGLGAVFCGIYFGDQSLYLIGRVARRRVVHRRPWKWLLRVEDLDRAARWFEQRGLIAILLTRFVPGTRLPTYVAAGVVRAGYWRFAAYFFVAVALWTPLLVGLSAQIGSEALDRLHEFRTGSVVVFAGLALSILLLLRVVVPLSSAQGRRRLWAQWMRLRHWEFWPSWLIYLPVVWKILGFARRYGGLRVVTAVNPGIPAGGLLGESKADILDALGGPGGNIPPYRRVPAGTASEQLREVENFLAQPGVELPIVIKPDSGERGEGVLVVRDHEVLGHILQGSEVEWIAQAYVPGLEYGVFYVRAPWEERGRVVSVNTKERLRVEGDGVHNLEHLILHHPRAAILAEMHLRANSTRLDLVPADGETVEIVEVGAHARGTVFRDARKLITPELERAIDELSRRFVGFHFGRYDLRVPDEQALLEGRDLSVIELNGLTSEAAHIYDPSFPLVDALRTLSEQWREAFAIGAANRDAGHPASSWGELLELWGRHRRQGSQRPASP